MLICVYYLNAFIDEKLSIGIYSVHQTSMNRQLEAAIVMSLWALLWVLIADSVIAARYTNITAHIWQHFFDKNHHFANQPNHKENLCDARSLFSVQQYGLALHGSIRLFVRILRLLYYAVVTKLCRGGRSGSFSTAAEAVFAVATFYNGIGFKKASEIFDKCLDESQQIEMEEVGSLYSVISIDSVQSEQMRIRNEIESAHKLKMETTGKKLSDARSVVAELEEKLKRLKELDKEQQKKRSQMKVVRDLVAAKEESLCEKESEVRYLLNTLLTEFEETKREVSECLDKPRISEIRKMTNPPATVKLTIEAVACLLGERTSDWDKLRTFITKDAFVPHLTRMDAETVTVESCKLVRDQYFSQKDFNFERVARASKTCALLYRWLDSLTIFALERDRIKPLLSEVDKLQ